MYIPSPISLLAMAGGSVASTGDHSLMLNLAWVDYLILAVVGLLISAAAYTQNFWMAIFAFVSGFIGAALISLAARRNRSEEELRGLVYALTDKPKEASGA